MSDLSALSLDVLGEEMLGQIYALAATVDARDPYTYGHSTRVASISEMIGKAMGLSKRELVDLHAAGLLHDIGKVGVPDVILTKSSSLTIDEWTVIKKHSVRSDVIYSQGKEVIISSDTDNISTEIDGDPGPSLPVTVEVIPQAVNVIAPENAKPAGLRTRILRVIK